LFERSPDGPRLTSFLPKRVSKGLSYHRNGKQPTPEGAFGTRSASMPSRRNGVTWKQRIGVQPIRVYFANDIRRPKP